MASLPPYPRPYKAQDLKEAMRLYEEDARWQGDRLSLMSAHKLAQMLYDARKKKWVEESIRIIAREMGIDVPEEDANVDYAHEILRQAHGNGY